MKESKGGGMGLNGTLGRDLGGVEGMGAVRPTAARQGLPVGALTTSCHSRSLRASSPQLTFISDPQTPGDKVLVPSPTSMLGKLPCGQLWTQQHWETGGEGRHHLGQSQLVELCRPETY